MTIRPLLFSFVLLAPLAAFAQGATPDPTETPDGGPEATVLDTDRFMLSETGDGVLRLDRSTGRVSLCREANGAWRCAPVADAERALEAEIERLTTENLRLSARNRELEAKILAISRSAQDAGAKTAAHRFRARTRKRSTAPSTSPKRRCAASSTS